MTIRHDIMTVTSCHDKESWRYTSQCILSTKRITYFIQTKYEQVWIIYMNEQNEMKKN